MGATNLKKLPKGCIYFFIHFVGEKKRELKKKLNPIPLG
jgi:hypothetical protein